MKHRKVSKYGVFSGPYFPAFGLNTEKCGVSLQIQFEYGKIRNRKNSVFGHFSQSVCSKGLRKVESNTAVYLGCCQTSKTELFLQNS